MLRLPPSRHLTGLVTVAAALSLAGCANMDAVQEGTAKGAGVGAVAGAVIGAATNGKKGATRGAVIGGAVGAIGGNIWSRKMEEKRAQMEKATEGTGAAVTRTADNQLKLEVPSDISFDTGSAALQPRLRSVLEQFANGLQSDPNMLIRVVGHTDSTGGPRINDPLSEARAASVRNFLVDRGVSGARIDTAGRGQNEPIASNATLDGRAKNRRVEIFLREPEVKS